MAHGRSALAPGAANKRDREGIQTDEKECRGVMERDSFIFYASFLEAIEEVDEATQLTVLKALARYALRGEIEELSGVSKALFALIRPQIDANNDRYKNSRNGGARKGNQNAKKQSDPAQDKENAFKQPTVDCKVDKKQPTVDFENEKKQPMVDFEDVYKRQGVSRASST